MRANIFLKDSQLEVVIVAEENGKQCQDLLHKRIEYDQGIINGIKLLGVLLISIFKALSP